MNKSGDMFVLQNRRSCNKFERVRKSQGLTGRKRKVLLMKTAKLVMGVRRHP